MLAWLHSLANLKRAHGGGRVRKAVHVSTTKKPRSKVRPKRPSATRKRKASVPVKHSYGFYEVEWGKWEPAGGKSRHTRGSAVLNGKHKGNRFLQMLVEPDDHGAFTAEVYPKNDYPGMPSHFRNTLRTTVKSVADGKKWCEMIAGID